MVKSEPPIQPSVQHIPPLSTSTKRKKQDDYDLPGQLSKKKPRTRVSYSCGECHRRKQKCDRQVPCSHCVARKVPELCKAYTPGKSDQDVHARLSRLEHIIELALPQFAGSSSSNPSSPAIGHSSYSRLNDSRSMTPDDEGSQVDDGDVGAGSFDGVGKWYGKSVSGSVAPVRMLEQLTYVHPSNDGVLNDPLHAQYMNYPASANRPNVVENMPLSGENEPESPMLQNAEPTAADLLQSLIRDCGLSENKLNELMQELPSRQRTDLLIDYYFKNMNWTRYPISEQDFRTSYAALFIDGVGSNPSDIRFLPLLFVVLAISVRLSPEHIGGNARERKLKSMRFYWSSRRALLIAAAIQPDSLEMVLTRLLSARYLTFDRRITECWSQLGAAVCTAQALGLHRDPAGMRLESAQVEYRRRIWAYLYHADRSYSMVLGRPYAIQDEYTTTLPPLNVEDLDNLTPSTLVVPSAPTRMSFVILRHGLAYLIGKMVHYFQRVRIQNHYSEVLALDDDLQKFIDNLPPHFSFNPDTSLDNMEKYSYIPLHRYLLTTEILFVRISLHRPFILRRLDSDRHARSRRAAFTAALKDFEVRQAYRHTQTTEVLHMVGNAYREFQTAMISGIYLVLDPCGKDAEAMHVILDTFLSDHESMSAEDLDDTTRREIKIIEFLKNKALQAAKNGHRVTVDVSPVSTSDQSMDAQTSANLLLNLQQSRNAHLQHARSASESAPSPGPRSAFASLNAPAPLLAGTSMGGIGPLPHSPTFQRVQAQSAATTSRHSPVGSGSPNADEDMSAQNMLDHWCNAVTNPPPLLLDQFASNGNSLSSGQWGTFPTGGSSGGVGGVSDWLNTPYLLNSDSGMGNGLEGADYNYWESLVNTIRGGPVQ
ncbi:fungal-specific transcription factor domain-containing protein [Phellopilus nigrolimitatus]|nr:fungal-specific transcription factor domain-containing protein [Phellopilus nigrolimitatus]